MLALDQLPQSFHGDPADRLIVGQRLPMAYPSPPTTVPSRPAA
jgi:PIN domain nuclease of toxin-antitoxin system